jgi:hypothetical protein
MIEASALSFAKEYDRLTGLLQRVLSPITPQEQQTFCKKMGIGQRGHNCAAGRCTNSV